MTGVQTCALPIFGDDLQSDSGNSYFSSSGKDYGDAANKELKMKVEIGRASCRERV